VSTKFINQVNTLTAQVWNHLLPTPCTLCNEPTVDGLIICQPCIEDLPTNPINCPRCALPMARPLARDEICGQCLRKPPDFDHAVAPLLYVAPVNRLISQLKYDRRLAAGKTFAKLIAQPLSLRDAPLPDALIAVPLHRQRLRQRGYNQSLEIARPLARLINRPLLMDQVERHKLTQPQTGLNAPARRKNLRGAFAVRQQLAGRHLAIIDDVMTTGSTGKELAKTLKKAGAERVELWVVARVTNPADR